MHYRRRLPSQSFSRLPSKQPGPGRPPTASLSHSRGRREGPPAQRESSKFLIKQPMEERGEHLLGCSCASLTDRPDGGGGSSFPGAHEGEGGGPGGMYHRLLPAGNLRRLFAFFSRLLPRCSAKPMPAQSIIKTVRGPCRMTALL